MNQTRKRRVRFMGGNRRTPTKRRGTHTGKRQKVTLEAEYNRGIATGKSWREIGAALGQIVKGWERGR